MASKELISWDTVLQATDDLTWRDVDNEIVVLDIQSGKYITFNEMGREIWLAVAEEKRVSEIVEDIMEKYEVDREKAFEGVKDFLDGLIQKKALKPKI